MYEPSYRSGLIAPTQALNMTLAALRELADRRTRIYQRPLLELATYRGIKLKTLKRHLIALRECGEVERDPHGALIVCG
jgi:hypothetical protein